MAVCSNRRGMSEKPQGFAARSIKGLTGAGVVISKAALHATVW